MTATHDPRLDASASGDLPSGARRGLVTTWQAARTRARTYRGWLGGLVVGLALGLAVAVVGMAEAGKLRPPRDPELLVAVAQWVDAAERRADLLIARGDIAGATTTLEGAVEYDWPSRDDGGDASVLLRHDLVGRLVRLRLDHPEVKPLDEAAVSALRALVDDELAVAGDELPANAFTARLHAIAGELAERTGDDDRALTAYERAMTMNRTLLDELVGEQR
jgi:hypothetical protein